MLYKVKGTRKQKMAIEEMVKNGGNVSRAMRTIGYSPETASTPQKLTESKGFKELCTQYGLTDDLILKSLVDDIEKKPQRRTGELSLGAEILGMKRREGQVVAVQVNIGDDRQKFA